MIYKCIDPVMDWNAYVDDLERKARLEAKESGRPICSNCHMEIVDEYMFIINGKNYCEQCVNDEFGVYTDEVEA